MAVLIKSLVYVIASLLLLTSTNSAVTWNIRSLNFYNTYSFEFGVAVSDNAVFFASGVSDQQLRQFDVVTGAVTALAQMPTNSAEYAAFCADRNGTLYLLYNTIFSTYNVSANTWTTGPSGFASRTYGSCVFNPFTNQIHFLGGSSTSHDVFDIETRTWNTTWPALPTNTGRIQQVYFDEVDQKIYVAGGIGTSIYYLVQIYHFSNDSWTLMNAPYVIQGDGIIRIGDEIQFLGGETTTGDKRRIQYYNVLNGTWTTTLSLQSQHVNTGNVFLIGTTLYLFNSLNLQWSHCYAVDFCGPNAVCFTTGCNATDGECTKEFTDNSCDDGDLCTLDDMCQLGVCAPGNQTNPSCVPISEPVTIQPVSEPITIQPVSEPLTQPLGQQPSASPLKRVSGAPQLFYFVPSILISWLVSAAL